MNRIFSYLSLIINSYKPRIKDWQSSNQKLDISALYSSKWNRSNGGQRLRSEICNSVRNISHIDPTEDRVCRHHLPESCECWGRLCCWRYWWWRGRIGWRLCDWWGGVPDVRLSSSSVTWSVVVVNAGEGSNGFARTVHQSSLELSPSLAPWPGSDQPRICYLRSNP